MCYMCHNSHILVKRKMKQNKTIHLKKRANPCFYAVILAFTTETRLDQRDLAVEIGLFLCMELEGNAADRGDALQHCERVPGVLERPQGGQSQIALCQPSC